MCSAANREPRLVWRGAASAGWNWHEARRSCWTILGEMDLATQRLLCATIESGAFRRVGGSDQLPLDVRLIGVTRFDPARDVARFDPQLLDVLGAIRIDLAPLREHLEDLPQIIQHMLDALTVGKLPAELDPAAWRVLLAHDWLGNARELGNVLQQALLAAGTSAILAGHLPPLQPQPARGARVGFPSEREWILDGLRRNQVSPRRDSTVPRCVAQDFIQQDGGTGIAGVSGWTANSVKQNGRI